MSQPLLFLPQRRTVASQKRLVDAGVRLFTGNREALTTRELAREAGLNHALISYHFGGMAGLMDAVVERCIQDLQALFIPEVEEFTRLAREAARPDLPGLLREYAGKLLDILAGPKGATLLQALSSPESAAVRGVYGRFAAQVLHPLHQSFVAAAAKGRGVPEDSLEAAVLAQCMVAQCMAFFRGARPVLDRLGKGAFTPADMVEIRRIVADSLCRNIGMDSLLSG